MHQTQQHYRACNLCEAICGLEITTKNREIISIRGDKKDPLSKGYICAKALALKDLYEDPDRLTQPRIRKGSDWHTIDWDSAIQLTVERLLQVRAEYGSHSVAVYQGNPTVHNLGMMTHGREFFQSLGTRNHYSATSVDQLPQQLVALWMYGHQLLLPVPDLDRTQLLILIGHNPIVSNGSLMTAPNIRNRIQQLQQRGGELVVIDPRFTETAALAQTHLAPTPGSDFYLLAAIVRQLLIYQPEPPTKLNDLVEGYEKLMHLFAPFHLELASRKTGIPVSSIQQLVTDILHAEHAVVHGRLGISTHQQGTLCHWACQLINLISGNFDAQGGALFAQPAIDLTHITPGQFATECARVDQLPNFCGEFPVSCLQTEIATPGQDQIRALVLSAGNPVLTTPAGKDLAAAIKSLEFCVAIDFYQNESSGLAHLILPPTMALERDHYDLIFHHFSVRNSTRWNQALWSRQAHQRHDWEIFNALNETYHKNLPSNHTLLPDPSVLIDMGLRTSSLQPDSELAELSLASLKCQPHGVDLGPLRSSAKTKLKTKSGKIQCAPERLIQAIQGLKHTDTETAEDTGYKLISRRDSRSNNSWGHNFARLTKGRSRFYACLHPDDMLQLDVNDEQLIQISSTTGEITLPVRADNKLLRGVVSVPFGWGHHSAQSRTQQANQVGGQSINDLTDPKRYDAVSGVAALTGTPVKIHKAH